MVTVKSTGVHGDGESRFKNLEEAKTWIYAQHWSLADEVTVEDEDGNEVFSEDAIDIRMAQVSTGDESATRLP